jgi:hypothetical protein
MFIKPAIEAILLKFLSVVVLNFGISVVSIRVETEFSSRFLYSAFVLRIAVEVAFDVGIHTSMLEFK